MEMKTLCDMIDSNSDLLDKLILGTSLDECMLIAAFLKHLEWSDDEVSTLPKKYSIRCNCSIGIIKCKTNSFDPPV